MDEMNDFADMMASSPDKSPEKMLDTDGKPIKIKPKKVKMCPNIIEKGVCHLLKEKKCNLAHNPLELDLIPVETKMKNLNSII